MPSLALKIDEQSGLMTGYISSAIYCRLRANCQESYKNHAKSSPGENCQRSITFIGLLESLRGLTSSLVNCLGSALSFRKGVIDLSVPRQISVYAHVCSAHSCSKEIHLSGKFSIGNQQTPTISNINDEVVTSTILGSLKEIPFCIVLNMAHCN